MANDVVVVLDCGATNVRAIAVDTSGKIVAKSVLPNATQPAAENSAWHIWSLDEILGKFAQCCAAITGELAAAGHQVAGVTVTTFGVDGAPVNTKGTLLYPIISWKCPRTAAVMANIGKYFAPERLQQISGVGHFTFNTLYKFIWLKENRPDVLERAAHWLFISSLINHRLTGVFSTDRTMAGTSQMFDLAGDQFSEVILAKVGIAKSLFPKIVNPGEVIGQLHADAAQLLGLPVGIPVTSAGHDTQFALFGSGAGMNQPVLSSGTWEILMARTAQVDTASLAGFAESTCELDSATGLYNPGLQWLASGVLEWVKETCWKGANPGEVYEQMIAEATAVAPGCDGVKMVPDLLVGGDGVGGGAFSGLSINSSRGHLYRATLEALSAKLAHQLHELERICGFKAEELILVGGGSKNRLWNQIKADALQIPVRVVAENEMTVLGAALYGFCGLGYYPSPEAASAAVHHDYQIFSPRQA
ncbi:MAG: L-fuculokinase [Propionivibrio sp.]|nr:L-fuculokinase [Propionivibrio sp.]